MKKFKKVAALALAAVMVLGVASTADVQAAGPEEYTVEDVLIVPVAHESDPEFSSYYADMKYTINEGELTAITITSGFGPQRAEGSNVTYTVNALSQYIDWLQTGEGDLSKLVSADVYSGATSSLGRFGSVHVELPKGLWEKVADKVDIVIVCNSTSYTVDGPGATETTTYTGYVQNGERYGFNDYKNDNKYLKKLKDGPIKSSGTSSGGGHGGSSDKVTLDEYIEASYLGEENGWRTYQIAVTTDEYKLNTDKPFSYFCLNYTRFEAAEVDENMATFNAETGLLKINMNSGAAEDEKAEVIDGLTMAKLTLKFVPVDVGDEDITDETPTYSGTVKIALTDPASDDSNTAGDNNNGAADNNNGAADNNNGAASNGTTTPTAPKTGDEAGSMYLVLAAGLAVAIAAASRAGRRARA